MKNLKSNYRVVVGGMAQHITSGNRNEEFIYYESAVTYFMEQCEKHNISCPEITHNPAKPVELYEGGIGHDYAIVLEFIND